MLLAAWQSSERQDMQQLVSRRVLHVGCCIMLLLTLGAPESRCRVMTIGVTSASCGQLAQQPP